MTPKIKPLVAGNWKMNGLRIAGLAEIGAIARGYDDALAQNVDLVICPPATLLADASAAVSGTGVATGGQDCHTAHEGAFTGDVSAAMIADAGAVFCIVGHSERRTLARDTDAVVRAKAARALAAGLTAIVCVGETRTAREAGRTLAVIGRQLRASLPETGLSAGTLVIAYEPVWAIGTGLTPTPDDVAQVHAFIRTRLIAALPGGDGARTRILYGGSVKPGNARALMAVANVDGALVGGASLTAADFLAIAGTYR